MSTLEWFETCDYTGARFTEVGSYKITEMATGHFHVALMSDQRLPIAGTGRICYSLDSALALAGAL